MIRAARAGRHSGHTLTELLVVLTILALIAFIAIPRFLAVLGTTRMDAQVANLRSDLLFARARAIATGRRIQVAMDPESRELVVLPYRAEEDTGTTAGPATDAPEPFLREVYPEWLQLTEWEVSPLGFNVSLPGGAGGVSQSGAPITFYPEGRSDAARILLEDAEGTRRGLLVDPVTAEIREMEAEELGR